MTEMRQSVFSIVPPGASRLVSIVGSPIERLLGLTTLSRRYRNLPVASSPQDFIESAFEDLHIRLQVDTADLDRVPVSGSTVVVANHPYGGIDGMALALLLLSVRPDVKVMANFVLGRIPELRDLFLLVDPFETRTSPRRSLAGLRQAFRWVQEGHLLAVFPAGEVAHFDLRERCVTDPPWLPTVGRIVRRADCAVVPTFFGGHNGPLFQLAGFLHPKLRTAMLPREFLARQRATVRVFVGQALGTAVTRTWSTDDEAVDCLRRRVEVLAVRASVHETAVQPRRTPKGAAALAPPIEADILCSEVEALPPTAELAAGGEQRVFLADADQIPNLLLELGRLRELTFREVGEGTGRRIDLDRFDQTYRHLFIWHRGRREVVGAYRVGSTEHLKAHERAENLYTSTLFRFNKQLFTAMGPALELGRSFIRPEYQRSFSGLMLLWKGIGRLVADDPSHATLFGPVSISAEYHTESQQLMAAFLKQNSYAHPWARWVRPRSPFRRRPSRAIRIGAADLVDLEEVSQFIAEIEADGKGVPILLRQYLKLGGRLLGFNIDPNFSNVLDVLIMVDLRQTESNVLARYMGREGADRFLTGQRQKDSPARS